MKVNGKRGMRTNSGKQIRGRMEEEKGKMNKRMMNVSTIQDKMYDLRGATIYIYICIHTH